MNCQFADQNYPAAPDLAVLCGGPFHGRTAELLTIADQKERYPVSFPIQISGTEAFIDIAKHERVA